MSRPLADPDAKKDYANIISSRDLVFAIEKEIVDTSVEPSAPPDPFAALSEGDLVGKIQQIASLPVDAKRAFFVRTKEVLQQTRHDVRKLRFSTTILSCIWWTTVTLLLVLAIILPICFRFVPYFKDSRGVREDWDLVRDIGQIVLLASVSIIKRQLCKKRNAKMRLRQVIISLQTCMAALNPKELMVPSGRQIASNQ